MKPLVGWCKRGSAGGKAALKAAAAAALSFGVREGAFASR